MNLPSFFAPGLPTVTPATVTGAARVGAGTARIRTAPGAATAAGIATPAVIVIVVVIIVSAVIAVVTAAENRRPDREWFFLETGALTSATFAATTRAATDRAAATAAICL